MNKNFKSQISNLPLKVAFLGTPEIAATILEDLLGAGMHIGAVITQPDRPCGRGKIMAESPVKSLAVEKHLPVYQPCDKDELTTTIKEIKPDICIVAAYGMLIPNKALEIPKFGMINFHPSMLPLLRGPSPIQMAIMCGHKETGVSIIQISNEMDAGDILMQQKVSLNGAETTPELSVELAHLGATMLVKTISDIANGKAEPKKQDSSKATYSKIIKKTDGEIFFKKYHAQNIEQAARAFMPWPGIYTTWNGKRVELFDISAPKGTVPFEGSNLKAGEVSMFKDKIAIGTAKGTILVGALKIEGKNKVTATQFVCGYQNFIGEKLA